MKSLLIATVVTMVICFSVAGQSPAVTYVPHDKVAGAIAKGGSLVTAPNLSVSGAQRSGPGQVEVHDTETDVLYIIDGAATFVTGGTVVGGKSTAPGQLRGTDIKGGETRQLTKGDVIVIPAGVAHWFKEVPTSVNYYVVKVIKQ